MKSNPVISKFRILITVQVRPSGSTNSKLIVSAFMTFDFYISLFNCINGCYKQPHGKLYFGYYKQDVEVIFHKTTLYAFYEYSREKCLRTLCQENLPFAEQLVYCCFMDTINLKSDHVFLVLCP